MLTSSSSILLKRWASAVMLTAAFGICATAHAQMVTLPSTVSAFNTTTGYTYSYSVTDSTTMPLAIVTLPTAQGSGLLNLIAPTGFGISYDSGNGLVSFFEENNANTPQTFAAGSTVSGFSFTSFYAPDTVTFNALDTAANNFTGTTQAPNAVPEPSSIVFAVAVFVLLGGALLRRCSLTPSALV